MSFSSIPAVAFGSAEKALITNKRTINVNIFTHESALSYIKDKVVKKKGFTFATINLDHIVKLTTDIDFFNAYKKHDVVVPDGFPIVSLGKHLGEDVERTTGADLVEPVMALLEKEGKTLAFVGTTERILEEVKAVLKVRYPHLSVVYTKSPPFGFDPHTDMATNILKEVGESGASVCFLALGAPKQEIFAAKGREIAPKVGFISIGAGLDFIAGAQKRAPQWAQKYNIEWLWRLVNNPRRLLWRYTQCVLVLPVMYFRSLRLTSSVVAGEK